jgi:hypothetical protein
VSGGREKIRIEQATMVMKVMQWPHRPSVSKKFQVNLALNRLEGVSIVQGSSELNETKLHVDVKWKGPKGALGSRFRSMKRGKTSAVSVGSGGKVVWEEEFESICVLMTGKTGTFQPWHVYLVLCKVKPQIYLWAHLPTLEQVFFFCFPVISSLFKSFMLSLISLRLHHFLGFRKSKTRFIASQRTHKFHPISDKPLVQKV